MSSERREGPTLVARTVRGSVQTFGAAIAVAVLGLVRSTVMARLLAPESFGVMALAMFFVLTLGQLRNLTPDAAFLHFRDDSREGLSAFVTLRMALSAVSLVLTLALAWLVAPYYPEHENLALAITVIAVLEPLLTFNTIGTVVLKSRMRFARVAGLDVAASVAMTVVGPLAAWMGFGMWALIASHACGPLVRGLGLWLRDPPFRTAFGCTAAAARRYFGFGRHHALGMASAHLLSQLDVFWIGTFIGSGALGFYTRALRFASYPRQLVSGPLLHVLLPAFTQLQDERAQRSVMFQRSVELVLRVSALMLGTGVVIAPEVIGLLLGERWLPIVLPFRLLLAHGLCIPLVAFSQNLFAAMGRPSTVSALGAVRLVAFAALTPGLAVAFGIDGVAAGLTAVQLLTLLLYGWRLRTLVDLHYARLFAAPLLALLAGCGAAFALEVPAGLLSIVVRGGVCTGVHLLVLALLEGRALLADARQAWSHVRAR